MDSILPPTLLAISRSWPSDADGAQQRVPNLYSIAFPFSCLQIDNLHQFKLRVSSYLRPLASDPRIALIFSLAAMKNRVDNSIKPADHDEQTQGAIASTSDVDGFNVELPDEPLVPMLTETVSNLNAKVI